MKNYLGQHAYFPSTIEDIKLENVLQFKLGVRDNSQKLVILEQVYSEIDQMTQCIIFMNSKQKAQKFKTRLAQLDITCELLLGGQAMTEDERKEVVKKFRENQFHTLITTNVIARGFDVPEVDVVVNLDLPRFRDEAGYYEPDYENFLHRVGRTGRFGTDGVALTIYKDGELNELNSGTDVEADFDEAPMLRKI